MAVINGSGTCRHCGESLTRRRYAAPHASDEHTRTYGIDVWVVGNGQFPGDQRVCEENILEDGFSWGNHEPIDEEE